MRNKNKKPERQKAPGLFITDLDGTLLTDERTLSPENRKALEHLRQKGFITVLATGRSMQVFDKTLSGPAGLQNKMDSLPFDYVIFSTGAGIMEYPAKNIILKKALTPYEVEVITACFDFHGPDYMVHEAIPHTNRFFYKNRSKSNPDFHTRLSIYPKDGKNLDQHHMAIKGATQVLAIIPPNADYGIINTLKQELPDFSIIQATSPLDHKSLWIEVFHKDVSKSRAAAFLAEKLSIERRNIIAIGNDYNDEDILHWAGKAYVVSNAPDALKRKYENVPGNNENGVAVAIRRCGWIQDSGVGS